MSALVKVKTVSVNSVNSDNKLKSSKMLQQKKSQDH